MLAGIHFDGDRLYIFFERLQCVLEKWPGLRAWKLRDGQWKKFKPDMDISNNVVEYHGDTKGKRFYCFVNEKYFKDHRKKPLIIEPATGYQFPFKPGCPLNIEADHWVQDHTAEISRQIRAYIETIPVDIRAAASQVEWNQWKLLKWARDYDGFVDLLRTNPALALGLRFASRLRPVGKTSRKMYQDLLFQKRRVIASFLGFPKREVSARILSRVSPDCLHIQNIAALKIIMTTDCGLKLLAHVNKITFSVLYFFSYVRAHPDILDMLTAGYLNEIAARFPDGQELYRSELKDNERCNLFYHLIGMFFDIRGYDGPRKILGVSDLIKKHDQVIRKATNELLLRESIDFPSSPLIDSDSIRHIKNTKELAAESAYMNHCVASYAKAAINKKYYLYRVLSPERATLSLTRKKGKWLIDQLKCKNDRDASITTFEHVNQWLGSQSKTIKVAKNPNS